MTVPRTLRRTLVPVVVAVAVAGCSAAADDGRASSAPSASPSPTDATDATGVRALRAGGTTLLAADRSDAAFEALVTGTVGIGDRGCVTVDGRLLIAPAGSALSQDGTTVLLTGYDPVDLGATATFGGGEEDVPADDVDEATRACLPADATTAAYVVVAPGDL